MRKLRYAMVGGGEGAFIGKIHRAAIRLDDSADIVAGSFNRSRDANLRVGESLGLETSRVYDDWRVMIAEEAKRSNDRPDFIVVCPPNYLHYPITKAALEAGFHVMCEKPMTLTVAEAKEIAELVEAKGLVFGLMHTYTGYPMVKLARDLVRRGDLGKICEVVVEYQQGSFRKLDFTQPLDKRNKWKMDPAQSGESCCMGDIGVHAFNLVEYVTGLSTSSLLADLSNFAPGNPLDDDGTVLLRFASGAKGVLVSSKIATGEENGIRLKVYGEKKSVVWKQEDPNYLHVIAQKEPEQIWKRGNPYVKEVSEAAARATRPPAGHPEGWTEAFANHYTEFCRTIREGGMTGEFPGVIDGVRGMRFVEAVVRSNRAGAEWTEI